jgi:hypothetical protein
MKRNHKQKVSPQGGKVKSKSKLILPAPNWCEEYEAYRGKMDGLSESDIHKWQNGSFWFNDKKVSPSFGKHFGVPYFYHAELCFTEKSFSDDARVEQVVNWIKFLNSHYWQVIQPVTFESHTIEGCEIWKEAKEHSYFIVKAAMFNEYTVEETQPKLHVLFTLLGPYMSQLLEDLGARLQYIAANQCECCVSSMEVNKIGNQAELLTMLLGVNEDRFFREIVTDGDGFVSQMEDYQCSNEEFVR